MNIQSLCIGFNLQPYANFSDVPVHRSAKLVQQLIAAKRYSENAIDSFMKTALMVSHPELYFPEGGSRLVVRDEQNRKSLKSGWLPLLHGIYANLSTDHTNQDFLYTTCDDDNSDAWIAQIIQQRKIMRSTMYNAFKITIPFEAIVQDFKIHPYINTDSIPLHRKVKLMQQAIDLHFGDRHAVNYFMSEQTNDDAWLEYGMLSVLHSMFCRNGSAPYPYSYCDNDCGDEWIANIIEQRLQMQNELTLNAISL
jgi:hypothetical protein